MMLVYLAARFSRKTEIKALVPTLAEHNIHTTSRWLDESLASESKLSDVSPTYSRQTAQIDLEDIDKCDTLVLFSEDPLVGTPRGGRHTEFGYALGKRKRLIIIGGEENIFHFLPEVTHYLNVDSFLEAEGIKDAPVAD